MSSSSPIPTASLLLAQDSSITAASSAFLAWIDRPLEQVLGQPLNSQTARGSPRWGALVSHAKNKLVDIVFLTAQGEPRPAQVTIDRLTSTGERVYLLRVLTTQLWPSAEGVTDFPTKVTDAFNRLELFVMSRWEKVRQSLRKASLEENPWPDSAQTLREACLKMDEPLTLLWDYALARYGQLPLDSQECHLRPLTHSALLTAAARASAKGLTFSAQLWNSIPLVVVSDPKRLGQIIAILAENAVDFTPKGAVAVRLRLSLREKGRALLRWEFQDEGPGLNSQAQSEVFHPLSDRPDLPGGANGRFRLGLALARHLAGLLGGALHVESEVGRGSVFALILPFEEPPEGFPEVLSQDETLDFPSAETKTAP